MIRVLALTTCCLDTIRVTNQTRPDRAQGLNNALRDAHQYVQAISSVLLDGASLDEAIEAYDTDVCERGFREISMSAEQAYATMHWDKYMESPVMKHGHANAK